MLILTRKPGESVYIGDDVKITIVEIKGHQIRVGIDAPRDLRIYREEIYEQIREENRQAAVSSSALERGLEGLGSGWGRSGSGEKKESGLQKLSSFKMKASSDDDVMPDDTGGEAGDDEDETPQKPRGPQSGGGGTSPQVVVRRKKRK